MTKVLIAYDNDNQSILHDFYESCADEAKQICVNHNINYISISPPNINEQSVIGMMTEHQLCVIAAHGDNDGIYNEKDSDLVSTHTTNYIFNGKGFYSIACSCAQNLCPHLQKLGLLLFVGYSDTFNVRGDRDPFVISAMSGLNSILSGDSIGTAKQKMLSAYDEQISILDNTDPIAAIEMVHNKERLVFAGDDNISIKDLR